MRMNVYGERGDLCEVRLTITLFPAFRRAPPVTPERIEKWYEFVQSLWAEWNFRLVDPEAKSLVGPEQFYKVLSETPDGQRLFGPD
jgi:hypothetical protein